MNALFSSHFKYYLLIWMCHSRSNNRKTDRLHGRCLGIISNNNQLSFKDLLEILLMIEMYKFWLLKCIRSAKHFTSSRMNKIFEVRNEHLYSLRCCSYGNELARLVGLAHLGEISPFLRNSFKKLIVFI